MVFGANILGWIPSLVWVVFYVITALVGVYFWTKNHTDALLSKAFVLYALAGVVLIVSAFGYVDTAFAHIVEEVLVLIGIVLVGIHAQG